MATSEKTPTLTITQPRLALALSLIALLATGHQISKFALDLQNRTARLEERYEQSERSQNELKIELNRLGTVLTELNITLREVQIRQEPKP